MSSVSIIQIETNAAGSVPKLCASLCRKSSMPIAAAMKLMSTICPERRATNVACQSSCRVGVLGESVSRRVVLVC